MEIELKALCLEKNKKRTRAEKKSYKYNRKKGVVKGEAITQTQRGEVAQEKGRGRGVRYSEGGRGSA